MIRQIWPLLSIWFSCASLDSCTPVPNWMGHDATTGPRGRNRWQGTAAGRRSDMVITPAVLSSPCFQHTCFQSCCGWERLLSPWFASSGQSVSSERQNLCTTPELNRGQEKCKGGGAIWPSGDRAAKKLQTLAFDDLPWPWPYVSTSRLVVPVELHTSREYLHPLTWSPCVAEWQLPR